MPAIVLADCGVNTHAIAAMARSRTGAYKACAEGFICMKFPMKRLLVLAALALMALPVVAAQTTALARLHAFAKGLHSLSGQFQQTLIDVNGGQSKASSGTVALEAPRQFRWQTTSPYKQLIVADGSRVWMYEPDLQQVTVRTQSTAEAHSPLTILTDVSRLDQDFTTTELGTRDGLIWLRLTPKAKHKQFVWVELGFGDDVLRAMRFKDELGNTTVIHFSHWKRNVPLPASTFTFTPPPGADVIGDAASIPRVHPLHR